MKKLWFTIPLFAVIFIISCLLPSSVSTSGSSYCYHFGIPDFLVVSSANELHNANIFNALAGNSGVDIKVGILIAALVLSFLFAVLIDDLLIAKGKEIYRKYTKKRSAR